MTRTDLYKALKVYYPTDTVDIDDYRVLIVSKEFEGLDKFQDRVQLLYDKMPTHLPVTLRWVLMTPEEVKTYATSYPDTAWEKIEEGRT